MDGSQIKSIPELYLDDETLVLAHGALLNSGLTYQQANDAITEMLNAGILIRELPSNNRRAELIAKARKADHIDNGCNITYEHELGECGRQGCRGIKA